MTAALFYVSASLSTNAATFTWDGGGGNNNWNTGLNWATDTTPSSGSDIVFAGTTRTAVNVTSYGTAVNSITFASGAGAFSLSNQQFLTGAGGITNNSTNTQTINSRIQLAANQTWNAANGAIISTDSYFNAANKNLTLTGGSAITIGGQVSNVGTLTLSGSGNRSFTSTNTLSATNVNINNSGTNTFAGQMSATNLSITNSSNNNFTSTNTLGVTTVTISNSGINNFAGQVSATTLNLTSGTSYFNQTGTSAQVGSGGINISGTANASFAGNVGSSGGITISSSGNVELAGNITSAALVLNGSGTTTLSGNGSNNISSTTVNSGKLVMAQTGSGDAINGPLIVNGGGTVEFANDDQLPHWQNVTLNEGSTLLLGDTVQEFTNLIVNGNASIDFGGGGSSLDIAGLTLNGTSVLTILNWNDSVDSFFANYDPGSSSLAKIVFDGYGEAVWDPYGGGGGFITPGTPVPEPSSYGALLMAGLLGAVGGRRRRHQS